MNKILFSASLVLVGLVQVGSAYGSTYIPENVLDESFISLYQGWDEPSRVVFYHTPQGSPIIPYDYFIALEQSDSDVLFLDETHLSGLGMLYWGKSNLNPDGLPIGLTIDYDIHGTERYLGMNCAACHVTEIKTGGKTVLIDGGVSHFDFWSFMQRLGLALNITAEDDVKFDRFATAVLKDDPDDTTKTQLRARLRGVVRDREEWAMQNAASVHPGPGRVDALNVILNQTSAHMLHRDDNVRLVDAPVSYPFLWDAPYLKYVQYNGVVPNKGAGALARNVGQVLGVFGQVSLTESTLPGGYASSVRVEHLYDLEQSLERLISPSWSELAAKGAVPEIDAERAIYGKKIFRAECASCHVEIDRIERGNLASIDVPTFGLSEIGTDPAAATSFAARAVASGPLLGRKAGYVAGEPMCKDVHGSAVLAHIIVGVVIHDLGDTYGDVLPSAANMVAKSVSNKVHNAAHSIKSLFGYGESTTFKDVLTDQQLLDKMNAQGATAEEITRAMEDRSTNKAALYDLMVEQGLLHHGKDAGCLETLQTAQYRARPLNGIWATGPFLHNGSVPTLMDLLSPTAERPAAFVVGNSDFDPVNIGFIEPTDGTGFKIDTQTPGNANTGHEYGVTLSEADKLDLLEYLKSL
ncbi:MAG: cytochrome c peroxidase [Halioglobus sp.]|jgi:cytochrome c peroxidase